MVKQQKIVLFLITLIGFFYFNMLYATATKEWLVEGVDSSKIKRFEAIRYSVNNGKVYPGYKTQQHIYKPEFIFWSSVLDFTGQLLVGGGQPATVLKFDNGQFLPVQGDFCKKKYYACNRVVSVLKRLDAYEVIVGGMTQNGLLLMQKKGSSRFDKLTQLPVENIWDIADAGNGYIYVLTGPLGQLFRVSVARGQFELWGQTQDSNLRSIMINKQGQVYIGGGERGNLYALMGKDQLKVLYHFPEEVIYKIKDYQDGILVFANKLRKEPNESREEIYKTYFKQFSELTSEYGVDDEDTSISNVIKSLTSNLSKSAVYWIGKGYRADRLLDLDDEYILDAKLDAQGHIYLATGPKSKVYFIKDIKSDNHQILVAQDFDYQQVTQIVMKSGQPAYYLTAGNEASLFTRNPVVSSGYFISQVFSSGIPGRLGRLYWKGRGLKVFSRHGNTPSPDNSWTQWITRKSGLAAELFQPDWLSSQLKFAIEGESVFNQFKYFYSEHNQRPKVTDIKIGEIKQTDSGSQREVTWKMADPNKDELQAQVWIKRLVDDVWMHLTRKQALTDATYQLMLDQIPDGQYVLKVSITDELSNYPDKLDAFQLSQPFLVDKLPPEWQQVEFDKEHDQFKAVVSDKISLLKSLAFSVDDGDWMNFLPDDGIIDEQIEHILLPLPDKLMPGVHTLNLKAIDAAGNQRLQLFSFRH